MRQRSRAAEASDSPDLEFIVRAAHDDGFVELSRQRSRSHAFSFCFGTLCVRLGGRLYLCVCWCRLNAVIFRLAHCSIRQPALPNECKLFVHINVRTIDRSFPDAYGGCDVIRFVSAWCGRRRASAAVGYVHDRGKVTDRHNVAPLGGSEMDGARIANVWTINTIGIATNFEQ